MSFGLYDSGKLYFHLGSGRSVLEIGDAIPVASAELKELFNEGKLEGAAKLKIAAEQAKTAGLTDLAAALEKAEDIAIISDGTGG